MNTGDIIEHGLVIYLVGDMNNLGGVCDDCTMFKNDDDWKIIGNIFDNPELISKISRS